MRKIGLVVAAVVLGSGAGQAQTAPSFAKKTVTIYVANTAGGSYDIYGRLIGRHLGNHLPGEQISLKVLRNNRVYQIDIPAIRAEDYFA